MAGRAYHHGDLRAALIQAGLAELDRTGPGELSLRALARAVGVSPTAVYRHFPDKGALLSALGQSVAERLGECQRQAADGARTLEDAFAAIGREYVRFALANPTHFRLMLACYQPREALSGEGSVAAHLLREQVAALTSNRPADAKRLEVQAWAIVHGLAMLMLDGLLPIDDRLIDEVVDVQTLFGLKIGSAN